MLHFILTWGDIIITYGVEGNSPYSRPRMIFLSRIGFIKLRTRDEGNRVLGSTARPGCRAAITAASSLNRERCLVRGPAYYSAYHAYWWYKEIWRVPHLLRSKSFSAMKLLFCMRQLWLRFSTWSVNRYKFYVTLCFRQFGVKACQIPRPALIGTFWVIWFSVFGGIANVEVSYRVLGKSKWVGKN